nr:hypothetical protein [Micromonospora sp. DSM 115978]
MVTPLHKITINLTVGGWRAANLLAKVFRCNKTDAINTGLRLAEQMIPHIDSEGAITVMGSDGTQIKIVVL